MQRQSGFRGVGPWCGILTAAVVAGLAGLSGAAAPSKPLATFSATEHMGLAWPRTLVTYRMRPDAGRARVGQVRLVDEAGRPHAAQLSRVRKHADGSIASARVSEAVPHAEQRPDVAASAGGGGARRGGRVRVG